MNRDVRKICRTMLSRLVLPFTFSIKHFFSLLVLFICVKVPALEMREYVVICQSCTVFSIQCIHGFSHSYQHSHFVSNMKCHTSHAQHGTFLWGMLHLWYSGIAIGYYVLYHCIIMYHSFIHHPLSIILPACSCSCSYVISH